MLNKTRAIHEHCISYLIKKDLDKKKDKQK